MKNVGNQFQITSIVFFVHTRENQTVWFLRILFSILESKSYRFGTTWWWKFYTTMCDTKFMC